MDGWGFSKTDWMVGKEVCFFLEGVLANPRKISRDLTIYVLRPKVPWKILKNRARLIFPPQNSDFARQYEYLQKKFNIGLDLWPIPDVLLKTGFLKQNPKIIKFFDQQINIESVHKFIFRLTLLSKFFLKQSVRAIRSFYFADKKRYQQRLNLYSRIKRGAQAYVDKNGMERATADYKLLMARAYPEIFSATGRSRTHELKGIIGYSPSHSIRGPIIKGSGVKRSKGKFIYIFSHFYPSDTKVLPFAKAVLTEGGGVLCHAAIVCREQKIPCLVGIRGLMASVGRNDEVQVDFTRARVIIQ